MEKQQDYSIRNKGIDKTITRVTEITLRYIIGMGLGLLAFLGQRNYKFIEAEE